MPVRLLLNYGAMTKLAPRRKWLAGQAGYNMIEMAFVMGIMAVLAGIAIVQIGSSRPGLVADGGMRVVIYYMNQAREMAITQRRYMRVVLTAPNQVQIVREEVPGPTLTTISSVVMEGQVKFTLVPGVPDTPDAFGNGTAVTFKVNGTDATELKFAPDGTFVNENGALLNGTVFVALSNQKISARAVTILGSTGRVRGYRWNDRQGNAGFWRPV